MVPVKELILLFTIVFTVNSEITCKSNSECAQGECCVFLMGRHGATVCQKQGRTHEECRPGARPGNHTLKGSPSSDAVEVTDVYYMLCPCQPGLACDEHGHCFGGLPIGSESHPSQVSKAHAKL